MVFGDLVRGFFDISVRRFRFFRIDNVDIIICHDLFLVKRDAVGIKYQNDAALAHALIVAEKIHQKLARRIEMVGGNGFELVPCKDYIVPVYEQIFRPGGDRLCFRLRDRFFALRTRQERAVLLHCAVGSLINGLQFLIERRARAGRGRAARHALLCGRGFLLRPEAAFQMHMLLDLVPADGIARAVGAENGIRRIGNIALQIVSDLFYDALRIAAWFIAAQRERNAPLPAGIRRHLARVIRALCHRCGSREDGNTVFRFRRFEPAAHALNVGHGAADTLVR